MCSTQMMVMPSSSRIFGQHVGRLVHLGVVEPAEAFVGQQQFRLRRQRARQFQLLQARRAQAVHARALARQADSPARGPPSPGPTPFPASAARPGRSRPRARRSPAATVSGTGAGSGRCARCRGARPCLRAFRRFRGREIGSSPPSAASAPAIRLKVVLLPEPFGPIRPRISPSATSKETRLTAVKPPKLLVRPSTDSIASPGSRAPALLGRRCGPWAAAAPGRPS